MAPEKDARHNTASNTYLRVIGQFWKDLISSVSMTMMIEGLLPYQRVPGVSTRPGDQDKVSCIVLFHWG